MATHDKGNSVTKTVSLPKPMLQDVMATEEMKDHDNFSRYVQDLIRADLRRREAAKKSPKK